MYRTFIRPVLILTLLVAILPCGRAAALDIEEGKVYVWVEKRYGTWENPLHSEFIVNGKLVNIYTSDTFESIEEFLNPGWNDITIKTIAQEPANKKNQLIFRIGPIYLNPKNNDRFIMRPVLWKFDNGTEWDFKDGSFFSSLGPDVKELVQNYRLYWKDHDDEDSHFNAGDYLLHVKQRYGTKNTPVIATVYVNDTPFSSFLGSKRKVVVTPYLKIGKNTIKIISTRVKNNLEKNDMEGSISGPAEWSSGKKKYLLKPITSFKAMQGWTRDKSTGQINSIPSPDVNFIERTISFVIKQLPESKEPAPKPTDKPSSLEGSNKI